jgi:endonuclease/exonuclease/phosphatase family metal-dependent hydrolase
MRLLAWNCNGGFRRKFDAVLRLEPDIAVVSEARQSCLSALDDVAPSAVWVGTEDLKGVAVIPFHGWTLERIGPAVSDEWFLPLVATMGDAVVQIIAVWVKRSDGYVNPTLRMLATLREFISARPTIVLGDFNQSIAFDKGRGPGRRFQDVIAAFAALHMKSAWHGHSGETHGAEGTPTLHWKWQADSPFHVDYAFVPDTLISSTKVSIGKYEDYVAAKLSDHLPLIIDIDLLSLSANQGLPHDAHEPV